MFLINFLIFISSFFSCYIAYAGDTLEIVGPADAFENEEVEFTITLNGDPVQARVSFGEGLFESYSNSSTGKVIFTTPIVPYEDKEYTITASLLGELYVYHKILVKNSTDLLNIQLSTDYIIETQEFTVTIKNREIPVADASVWFHSKLYLTDINGEAKLVAPDVLVSTNYGISVNKTGYKSTSYMVTIYNNNLGLLFMDVIYPYIVESGGENIKFTILDQNGGISGVDIEIFYENSNYIKLTTDNNGNVFFDAPHINNDNFFSFIVDKEGYSTYYYKDEYIVSLFVRDFDSDLNINVFPTEVDEGDLVTVQILNDIGIGVEGVSVWRGSDLINKYTDSEGYITFASPSVFLDREIYLFAVKESYNFVSNTITIRDRVDSRDQLFIESDNILNESEYFSIFVKDKNNILLSDVLVSFNSEQKKTDGHGMAIFYAPNISSISFYQIEAVKSGYQPATLSVVIIPNDRQNISNDTILMICVEPFVFEYDDFIVTIRDDMGYLVSDALVTFKGTSLKTNTFGEVAFSAPIVNWDEIYKISVTKTGFSSASSEIIIKNIESFEYWYLIAIMSIIFIIGVFYYFRFKMRF